jgi:hypothetical protein
LIREKKLAAIRLGARWRVDPADLVAFIARSGCPRFLTRVASTEASTMRGAAAGHIVALRTVYPGVDS